jgi:hypothetical protein
VKRVIVFGAGASASMGVPTMDRFIDAAEDLKNARAPGITQAHFDLFFDVLQNKFRQLHAKSAVDLDNIETVFGLIEMARLLGRLPGFDQKQIEELATAVRTVLFETVMLTGAFDFSAERGYSPPRDYLSVAGYLDRQRQNRGDDRLVFITFNYDLGLDFALHWSNFSIDYGLGDQVPPESIQLYKLHGSLHWISCKVCHKIRAVSWDRISQAYAGTRSLHASSAKFPIDPRRAYVGLGPHCPGDALPFEVALVPPSWNKTQYWQQLSGVWSAAARELSAAHEIILIGYSLPDSDSFFRDLLALGLEGETRVRAFTVVNPDPKVAPKLERLLGPEVKPRFKQDERKFEEWVKSTYGTSPRAN